MKVRFAHTLAAVAVLATTATHAAMLPATDKTDAAPAATPTFAPDASWTWMADNDAAVRPLRQQPGKGDRNERAVPEPGILALLVLPALALAATARRRRSR